jgi:hypothetical protein
MKSLGVPAHDDNSSCGAYVVMPPRGEHSAHGVKSLPLTHLRMLNSHRQVRQFVASLVLGTMVLGVGAGIAEAQRVENQVAVFAALDKVTARISRLEIKLNDTVKFGALKVTPRVCYSRPPDQPPKTDTFVEVQEIQLDGSEKKIFSGWMFAESPGVNAVEHPVYDVWLTECISPKIVAGRTPPVAPAKQGTPPVQGQAPAVLPPTVPIDEDFRRRRPPR